MEGVGPVRAAGPGEHAVRVDGLLHRSRARSTRDQSAPGGSAPAKFGSAPPRDQGASAPSVGTADLVGDAAAGARTQDPATGPAPTPRRAASATAHRRRTLQRATHRPQLHQVQRRGHVRARRGELGGQLAQHHAALVDGRRCREWRCTASTSVRAARGRRRAVAWRPRAAGRAAPRPRRGARTSSRARARRSVRVLGRPSSATGSAVTSRSRCTWSAAKPWRRPSGPVPRRGCSRRRPPRSTTRTAAPDRAPRRPSRPGPMWPRRPRGPPPTGPRRPGRSAEPPGYGAGSGLTLTLCR